jgi:predicted RND superfamily exporter protein
MPFEKTQERLAALLVDARRRSKLVLLGAVIAGVVGGLLVARVSFDPNVLRLLPRHTASVRDFEGFLRNFGGLESLYLVFESSDPISAHEEFVDAFIDALKDAPEIESVDAQLFEPGKDWGYLYDRELYLLGPDGAREALARMQAPKLDEALARAREVLLTAPTTDIKQYVQQDPLALLRLVGDRFGGQKGLATFDPTQPGYVSPDGRARLVIVKPRGAPFDTDFCKALFSRLDAIERRVRGAQDDAGTGTVSVQGSGGYRVSLEAEALIRKEGIVNSVGSLVLLLLLVFVLFRTPWMMIYGSIPLAIAATIALGATGLIKGRLTPATSGSAGMLFGLGIDGVVLLYMRFLEERESGASPDEAIRRLGGPAFGVALAQITTAATFLALLLIDFPSLQELGSLVGIGILLTCAATLVLLPALVGRGSAAGTARTLMARGLSAFVARRARSIVIASIVATVVLGLAGTRLRVNMSLDRLQAQTKGSQLERDVAARFSLPTDVLLAMNEGERLDALVETDRRVAKSLEREQMTVSGIGLLLPPAGEQQAVSNLLRESGTEPIAAMSAVQAAADRIGFRRDAFAPFSERVPRLLDRDARITYEGLVDHGLDSIVSRFVVRRDGRYQTVTYLYPQRAVDLDALETTLHQVDPALRLTGVSVINRDLKRKFGPDFLKAIVLGTLVVALLIYAVFRNLGHTMLALVPLVGFVWSAGLLALAGAELDLFSMFAAVTCVGIAVDYGIYVMYRYAAEEPRDIERVVTRTGAAILIACSTALVGFGSLINSSYRPLQMFGIVSVVTLACCVAAALILLPAMIVRLASSKRSG